MIKSADADADGDGTPNSEEEGFEESPLGGTLEGIYVFGYEVGRDDDWRAANSPWDKHGVCSCKGHWWEITFNSDPDHDTEDEMKKCPGPIIQYPGPLLSQRLNEYLM